MTNYFQNLELALQYYESVQVDVDFENAEMYYFECFFSRRIDGFIFQCGAPKEVRVSSLLVENGLEQICEICGIKLRCARKLQAIEEFREGVKHFM